jgi:hypothetical protein
MNETKETKRTPGPWMIDGETWLETFSIVPEQESEDLVWSIAECNRYEDAAFIVRACNSHDDLVAALTAAEIYLQGNKTGRRFEESDVVGLIQNALKKARQ